MRRTREQKVVEAVRKSGILRPRDLDKHNIPRVYLQRLTDRGILERVAWGLYRLPGSDVSEHHTLAEVGKKNPKSVICLLSALSFHELTTQNPFQVWIALDPKARMPRTATARLRVVRFSGAALREGVETHTIEGVKVRVYSIPKTVADCFKYRNKIGLDVAIEALRDSIRKRRCTRDDIRRYARVCRVAAVMRPYMESL